MNSRRATTFLHLTTTTFPLGPSVRLAISGNVRGLELSHIQGPLHRNKAGRGQ